MLKISDAVESDTLRLFDGKILQLKPAEELFKIVTSIEDRTEILTPFDIEALELQEEDTLFRLSTVAVDEETITLTANARLWEEVIEDDDH